MFLHSQCRTTIQITDIVKQLLQMKCLHALRQILEKLRGKKKDLVCGTNSKVVEQFRLLEVLSAVLALEPHHLSFPSSPFFTIRDDRSLQLYWGLGKILGFCFLIHIDDKTLGFNMGPTSSQPKCFQFENLTQSGQSIYQTNNLKIKTKINIKNRKYISKKKLNFK